jgi:hypothetical protein
MPGVICLENFHYIEKYFGEKKLEFLNASVKMIFLVKKSRKSWGLKKKLIGNASVFFPQQFCLFWTKVCGINNFSYYKFDLNFHFWGNFSKYSISKKKLNLKKKTLVVGILKYY